MYNQYFGLRASPFGSSPDPRFLCLLPDTREAMACLQYGIITRRGFVVMTGEVGTGKTTILRTVLDSFVKEKVSTAFVFNPRLDALDFLEFVLTDFGLTPTVRTKAGMLLQLNKWLVERFREGALCVIMVDEAQNLEWDMLEEIRLLTNLETSSHKLLQIVLSGQPELEERLRAPRVRQLRQRVSVWCKTRALTLEETRTYISERLRLAGAKEQILSHDAVEQVHRWSSGIPRLINLICEHALINAFVEQVRVVPAHLITSVAKDLDLKLNDGVAEDSIEANTVCESGALLSPDPVSQGHAQKGTITHE